MNSIDDVFNECINCMNVPDEEYLYNLYCKLNGYGIENILDNLSEGIPDDLLY